MLFFMYLLFSSDLKGFVDNKMFHLSKLYNYQKETLDTFAHKRMHWTEFKKIYTHEMYTVF